MDLRPVAPLFLLALTAGYVFSQTFYLTRWRTSRSEGQRLLFESALWGAILTAFSWSLSVIADWINPRPWWLVTELVSHLPQYPGLVLFIWTMISGILLPFLLNPFVPKVRASRKIIQNDGSDLELLILKSQERSLPLLVTLSSGKVYTGFCMEPPNPIRNNDFLTILPSLSGYRDKETQTINMTTLYSGVYKKIAGGQITRLKANDFLIVVRADEILHASLYSNLSRSGLFDFPTPEKRKTSGDQ